jgi:hypothetical protein
MLQYVGLPDILFLGVERTKDAPFVLVKVGGAKPGEQAEGDDNPSRVVAC